MNNEIIKESKLTVLKSGYVNELFRYLFKLLDRH